MARLKFFVACPYTVFPMDDYKNIFSSVKKALDVDFKFADEQITNEHILKKITDYIRDADISLFDITGWNPNVALELGIAVGLNRRYFILWNPTIDAGREVPSDIKGIDRIQYGSNSELEAKLLLLVKQELPSEKTSDSAFDAIKARIIKSLSDCPGQNIGPLAEEIGEDKTLVQTTVRAMVGSDELKTRGAKKGMRYFTSTTDMRTVAKHLL